MKERLSITKCLGKNYFLFLLLLFVIVFLSFLFLHNNPLFFSMMTEEYVAIEEGEIKYESFTSSDNVEKINVSELNTGSWAWPTIDGCYISQGYLGNSHDAIDIAGCAYNSAIYAANSGVVETVSTKKDNGLYIIIRHSNGYRTLYCHLASVTVSAGQTVSRGQVIAGMGRSGRATGVHLHFALWKGYPYSWGSKHMDPWQLYR